MPPKSSSKTVQISAPEDSPSRKKSWSSVTELEENWSPVTV